MSAQPERTETGEFEPVGMMPIGDANVGTGEITDPKEEKRRKYFDYLNRELERLATTRARGGRLGKPHVWLEKFIDALGTVPVIDRACTATGVHRSTVDYWRRRVPAIERAIQEAVERGVDRIEAKAFDLAHDGHQRPVYQGGQKVGEETVYHDRLIEMVLRGRRRDVYGDRTELTGAGGGPVQVVLSCQAPPRRERIEAQTVLAPPEDGTEHANDPGTQEDADADKR